MIEIIDVSGDKMMALVIANVCYMDDNYIIYCIDRGNGDANIFVSKLVMTSDGYMFNNDFMNGEKEVMDGIVERIINRDNITSLGFGIGNDIKLVDVNYFDIDRCYVATVSKKVIKEIMINYQLVNEKSFDSPVVSVALDKKIFNEGFVGNIFLIVFGVCVIVFCIWVLVGVFK